MSQFYHVSTIKYFVSCSFPCVRSIRSAHQRCCRCHGTMTRWMCRVEFYQINLGRFSAYNSLNTMCVQHIHINCEWLHDSELKFMQNVLRGHWTAICSAIYSAPPRMFESRYHVFLSRPAAILVKSSSETNKSSILNVKVLILWIRKWHLTNPFSFWKRMCVSDWRRNASTAKMNHIYQWFIRNTERMCLSLFTSTDAIKQ